MIGTSEDACAIVGAYGSGGSASVNASYNKAKVDYAQVNEQAGIRVGEDGIDANIHNHAQLNAAIIESSAEESKNRFKTKSLSHTDIENRSEIKTESASIGAGTGGINPMQAISSTLSLLGNTNESARSTTKSAISGNIQIDTETPENLTALSRDTKNANQRVEKQDLQKVQERQEMAKVIGDITNNAINIATYNEREKINKLGLEKFKLEEKYGKDNPQAQEIGKQITAIQNDIDRTYGIGSEKGMAIHAVTAALQAAAQNDTAGSLVALASPYLNQKIHEMTAGDTAKDKATNLMAHALLSAVEFQVTGKDPLTGAVAGVTGEATAEIIARAYGKPVSELTANEKENISTLSQLAGGLAAALTAKANGTTAEQGGSFIAASSGAETAKRAVENNALTQGDIHGAYQRLLNGENIEVVLRDLEHLSQKERAKLLADCDAACRQVVPSLLMAANDFSEEQIIALGSILSKIPAEQRSRVDMLVQSENSKTLEAIENSKSDVEKHIALAVKVMRFFQAENAVSGGKSNKPKAISVHSENKDYSKDVANLGVNRNKGLNERISNRQKDHYINEQATKNVHKVTAPIDFDGHILNAEIKGKKVVGGHSIASGNIRVDKVVKAPNANGVYEAKISVRDPNNPGKFLSKTNNNGKSTMFPDSWTSDRLKVEVDYAYKNRVPHSDPLKASKGMWQGVTKSGVKVEGYVSPKTTAYPLM